MVFLKKIFAKRVYFPKGDCPELSVDSFCKICLETHSDHEMDFLISPCNCKGSMQYVHRECLRRWRYFKRNQKLINSCDQCTHEYEVVDEFIPRGNLVSFLSIVFLILSIYSIHYIIHTLLEAYVYTYKVYFIKGYTSLAHEFLMGQIKSQDNKTLIFLEKTLKDYSITKTIVLCSFFNNIFIKKLSEKSHLFIFSLLFIKYRWLKTKTSVYLLFTFAIYSLKNVYNYIYKISNAEALYFLNGL